MKLICDRAALVEALALVGSAVVSRTPKPVLTCVKLDAGDTGLTLTATDLEVAIQFTTGRVEVQQPGAALVPADKLSQIVRESVDATLTIETDGTSTTITGQDSRFSLLGYPASDFPATPPFKGEADFEIDAADLIVLINQTLFATARENSRYAINGVLMEREGHRLSVVATDGRRLAMAKGSCRVSKEGKEGKEGQDAEARTSAIVPSKALNILQRVVSDAEQPVRVKLADNRALFATADALLVTNLVEGAFPPYKDVIPRDGDKKATLAVDPFVSAVRRAALLTNDESKGVRMAFGEGEVKLTSRAPEMGEAEITLPMEAYEGEPIEIGFNPTFLLDALKVVGEDRVTIDFKAPSKPAVMRTGPNFLYVIMPVNLQS